MNGQKPELLLGDFKRFTSKAVVSAIKENAKEPRNKFLLNFFLKEGLKASNVNQYQFWRHDNHPIELWSNRVIWQKINYTHKNPVKAGLVTNAEEYRYSSAIDYADEKGLLEDIVVFRMFNI
ncbi:hypothetical protein [Chryseobacterium sp.]|uniref:hypothetical protein n=1 Tax=Chryseobacterium sp. TaxID=1871047 RepID=UPI00289E44C5|nr:hypothetical protein [Chryseobacterium sp.]